MESEVRNQMEAKMSGGVKPTPLEPRPSLSPTPAERYQMQMEAMHEAMSEAVQTANTRRKK